MITLSIKIKSSDCIFSAFSYFRISVFSLGEPTLIANFPCSAYHHDFGRTADISSATKVTDWHTAPSICVTTDQLPGTASVTAQ